ncbi:FOX1 [Scenedesmus sp. PABB004]|nr:FOX1 [Scenedesmus sp. PABB004]
MLLLLALALAAGAAGVAGGPLQQRLTLTACLRGVPGLELHLPGSPDYGEYANGLRIPRLHTPAAVVLPSSVPQVQAAVVCAVRAGVQPIPRAGGNSFEALSSGDGALVIDLSANMGAVLAVDVPRMTATMQGGVRMGNAYVTIARAGAAASPPRNLTCVGSVWLELGVAGLIAAGGYGSLTRAHGMMADHVLSARVVDARGRLLTASPTENPELFFALRGGGSGTYGVLVEVTVRVIEVPVATVARINYRGLGTAVELLDRFQRWAPGADRRLTLTFNVVRAGSDIKLYWLGDKAELRRLINASGLAALPGADYVDIECDVLGSRGWLVGSGWAPLRCPADNVAVPARAPGGPLMRVREASKYKSAIFNRLIPRTGLAEIVALVQAPGSVWKLFQFKAYGGALADVPANFNAFPYRRGTLMHLEWGSSFGFGRPESADDPRHVAAVWSFIAAGKAALAPLSSGGHYNGYVSLDDSVASYFGPNFDRLRAAKRQYDPANVFRNALSVPRPAGTRRQSERRELTGQPRATAVSQLQPRFSDATRDPATHVAPLQRASAPSSTPARSSAARPPPPPLRVGGQLRARAPPAPARPRDARNGRMAAQALTSAALAAAPGGAALAKRKSVAGSTISGIASARRQQLQPDFDFSLGAAKAKVLRAVEEGVAPAFVRFFNSALFDRLLTALALYLCATFQHEALSRCAERARAQHQLDGFSAAHVAARLRELADEAAAQRAALSQPYAELLLTHSARAKPQQDRRGTGCARPASGLRLICSQAGPARPSPGRCSLGRHFNSAARRNGPQRSVDSLTVTQLWSLKHETANRSLHAKLITGLREKPPTLGVQAASVAVTPLVSQAVTSPLVARSLLADPAERGALLALTLPPSRDKGGAGGRGEGSGRAGGPAPRSRPGLTLPRPGAAAAASAAARTPGGAAREEAGSPHAAAAVGRLPPPASPRAAHAASAPVALAGPAAASPGAPRASVLRPLQSTVASLPEAAGLPLDETYAYLCLLRRYMLFGPTLGLATAPAPLLAMAGAARGGSMTGSALAAALGQAEGLGSRSGSGALG